MSAHYAGGWVLRMMRETMGLSMRQLATLAEVEPGYLSQVERGIKNPSDRWLRQVTDALGVRLAEKRANR
ncbi:XRE family transcriptional regulator [Nocardioides immobilis]|uniref:XRE family transcriptional regulator n=1 Tax=Nocardioides immobilis TaxID=2049295 RepID=A0A417Y5D3_9ACTN|nr:helix-turn-helix transcriptional regulator [Nocardioides immobilis]RHW27815.1 XRE family transcriptional regulator [Nocardioides immobilis]